MTDVATNEPLEITAGNSVTWKRTFDDYLASDSWVLTYALLHRTNTKITITSSADGDDHLVDEAAADTVDWTAGDYTWQAYVTKGADRFQVDSGTMTILPNLAAATNYDGRSHARITLDNIEAVIQERATKDQESYVILGRSLSRTPMADLITLHSRYKRMVKAEEDAEKVANGIGTGKKVLTRF